MSNANPEETGQPGTRGESKRHARKRVDLRQKLDGMDARSARRWIAAFRRYKPRGPLQIEQLHRASHNGHALAGFCRGDKVTYRAGMRVCAYCGRRVKRHDQFGQGMAVRAAGAPPVEFQYVCHRCVPTLLRDMGSLGKDPPNVRIGNRGHAWERARIAKTA